MTKDVGNDLINNLSSIDNRRYVEAGYAQEEGHMRHYVGPLSPKDAEGIAVLDGPREVGIARHLANYIGHVEGTQCGQDANEYQHGAGRHDATPLKRRR